MPTRVPWRRRRYGARMMRQQQVSRRDRLASWRHCRRPRSPTFSAAPVSPRMASPRSPGTTSRRKSPKTLSVLQSTVLTGRSGSPPDIIQQPIRSPACRPRIGHPASQQAALKSTVETIYYYSFRETKIILVSIALQNEKEYRE